MHWFTHLGASEKPVAKTETPRQESVRETSWRTDSANGMTYKISETRSGPIGSGYSEGRSAEMLATLRLAFWTGPARLLPDPNDLPPTGDNGCVSID